MRRAGELPASYSPEYPSFTAVDNLDLLHRGWRVTVKRLAGSLGYNLAGDGFRFLEKWPSVLYNRIFRTHRASELSSSPPFPRGSRRSATSVLSTLVPLFPFPPLPNPAKIIDRQKSVVGTCKFSYPVHPGICHPP